MNRFKVTTYNINLNMVKLVLSPYRLHNLLSKKISKVCRAFDLQYLTFVVILELEECIFWILCFIFWSFIFHFVYCVFFTFMPMLLEGCVFLGSARRPAVWPSENFLLHIQSLFSFHLKIMPC